MVCVAGSDGNKPIALNRNSAPEINIIMLYQRFKPSVDKRLEIMVINTCCCGDRKYSTMAVSA
ncbi:hypothetical protein BGI30_02920 [Snodgrassella alvi]|uniref:Uncharacterized protein n=1 Tax=Snodgrassella alvi TaxID=1196083 RepID=A0A2N9XWK3_9NEIS|nr:hypothetical protein BGI30_02920 [Snodgrassella alvi]PIT54086.1 hypothetical protein BHC49_09060 [Snodgrassella alvi]PIT57173.1 hypothetical protein BHC59_04490 [Snodgrassella alvi]